MANRKYLVYKITNRFDGKIYVGCHSTLNKDDRYMGSGVEIKEALKKYGRKSFVKEILFEFDTKEEMLAKEKELVTKEFCMREDTYNRIEGGGTYLTEGMVVVKDKEGNSFLSYKDNPKYLSGEYLSIVTGKVCVFDEYNKLIVVDKNHPDYLTGKYIYINKNKLPVKDKYGNTFQVSKEDNRLLSGELIHTSTGLSGVKSFLNKTHSEKTKQKMSEKAKQRTGDKNSSFGTCWITKENQNKKIKKEDLEVYLLDGWLKGRNFINEKNNINSDVDDRCIVIRTDKTRRC